MPDYGRNTYNVIICFSRISMEKVNDKLLRLPDGKSAVRQTYFSQVSDMKP